MQTLMSASLTTVDVVNYVRTLTDLSSVDVIPASRLETTPSLASVTYCVSLWFFTLTYYYRV